MSMTVVNEVKVQTAELLRHSNALPHVLRNAAVIGAERSREVFDGASGDCARRVGRVLACAGDDARP